MDRERSSHDPGDQPDDLAGAAFVAELARFRIGPPLRISDELASFLDEGRPVATVAVDDGPVIDLPVIDLPVIGDAETISDQAEGVVVPFRRTVRRRTRAGVASAAVMASVAVLGVAQVLPAAAQSMFSHAASAIGIEIGDSDSTTTPTVDAGSNRADVGVHAKDPSRRAGRIADAAPAGAPDPSAQVGAASTGSVEGAVADRADLPTGDPVTEPDAAGATDSENGNGDANGVGNGGTPPGQREDTIAPDGTPPGHGGVPPGHGGTPPGLDGTPPGQTKKAGGVVS
ncbi:MAG: hypothetical protein ABW033_04835 [Acidimicrobiia bacterium]